MQRNSYDEMVKIMLIGDSNVGKTSIMRCFCNQEFKNKEPTTIGLEYSERIITINEKRILVQLWDTAGQEKFRNITPSYYRSAMGILLVYSVKDRESFNSVEMWMRQIRGYTYDAIPVLLVANKIDEEYKEISEKESQALRGKNNVDLVMTSAKTNKNIDTAIINLYHQIGKHYKSEPKFNIATYPEKPTCAC